MPDDTIFIGGLHNTTTDTVEFFDVHLLPDSHRDAFSKAQAWVHRALGKNAFERCKRFLLAMAVNNVDAALRHVKLRATDLAEVRPELNHATNAAVVVGRRGLTKGDSWIAGCSYPLMSRHLMTLKALTLSTF